MTIFELLNDILYKKKGDKLSNPDAEAEFQPYLVQRWLSMYSPDISQLINQTTNILYSAYENKQEWYKAFLTIIPPCRFKKISYIKKSIEQQKLNKDEREYIKTLAAHYEISEREVKDYLQQRREYVGE